MRPSEEIFRPSQRLISNSMPSRSKIKGSGFEREVAKYLTETYQESFIRNNSGSGAYIGGKNTFRKASLTEGQIRHTKGDIVPPESWRKFNAEAKFYSDLSFHQLWDTCPQIESWLDQLMAVADPGDVNILFAKFNRKGRYVAVQASAAWDSNCSHMRYTSPTHGDWMIYSLETFFKLNRDHLKTHSTEIAKENIQATTGNNIGTVIGVY